VTPEAQDERERCRALLVVAIAQVQEGNDDAETVLHRALAWIHSGMDLRTPGGGHAYVYGPIRVEAAK
jgi:hypothetical protein